MRPAETPLADYEMLKQKTRQNDSHPPKQTDFPLECFERVGWFLGSFLPCAPHIFVCGESDKYETHMRTLCTCLCVCSEGRVWAVLTFQTAPLMT